MDTIPHGKPEPPKNKTAEKKADDTQPTTAFVPPGWEGLPMPGDEVEVVRSERKRRGEIWKVAEIQKAPVGMRVPGRMILVPMRNVKRL